eukprot:5567061-Amphidinium_carterae.1
MLVKAPAPGHSLRAGTEPHPSAAAAAAWSGYQNFFESGAAWNATGPQPSKQPRARNRPARSNPLKLLVSGSESDRTTSWCTCGLGWPGNWPTSQGGAADPNLSHLAAH